MLGIGAAHAPGTLTADLLTIALERALSPDVATRARSIAASVRRDGTQIAAERFDGPRVDYRIDCTGASRGQSTLAVCRRRYAVFRCLIEMVIDRGKSQSVKAAR